MHHLRSMPRRALLTSLGAGTALILTVSVLLGPTGEAPATLAAAAPASDVLAEPTLAPAPALTASLVATEVRTRTPAQARADRERSIRASRMARVAQMRTRIVDVARKQIGDRYAAGNSGPHAFDCSGLTRYVYQVATGQKLPHSSRAQYTKVKKIKRSQAQPGDLVFFFENGEHHVGIYIGKGRMIDAPGVGDPVRVSPISGSWWGRSYTGMGRILPG
jgi:cell wall-associated NlpC family hydrolase